MTESPAPRKKTPRFRKLAWLAGALILSGSLCLSYMHWEANTLTLHEETAPADCLPRLSGLRILILSDIHSNLPLLKDAVTLAQQTKPDIIVFLGDLYSDYQRATHAGEYMEQLKKLSSLAPSYACLGNHDMDRIATVERILKEGGFALLRNSAIFLTLPRLGDTEIKLAGVGDLREGDCFPEKCMTPKEFADDNPTPTIVLCHNPMGRTALNRYQWDLMLSGHTHGGQIALPFTSTPLLLTEEETMAAGFYPFDERQIFITRGIGSVGPGRFNCPPEISLITIP